MSVDALVGRNLLFYRFWHRSRSLKFNFTHSNRVRRCGQHSQVANRNACSWECIVRWRTWIPGDGTWGLRWAQESDRWGSPIRQSHQRTREHGCNEQTRAHTLHRRMCTLRICSLGERKLGLLHGSIVGYQFKDGIRGFSKGSMQILCYKDDKSVSGWNSY